MRSRISLRGCARLYVRSSVIPSFRHTPVETYRSEIVHSIITEEIKNRKLSYLRDHSEAGARADRYIASDV